jgi:hypothetical protein
MWAGGQQDCNKITPVYWPLTVGRYSVTSTCCPLTMDSYSAGGSNNPTLRRACTRCGEMTGRDNLYTIEDIISYTSQVAHGYVRIRPPQCHLSGPGSYCVCRGLVRWTPHITKSLIKLIKLQLRPQVRLIKSPKFKFEFKCKDWRFQVFV